MMRWALPLALAGVFAAGCTTTEPRRVQSEYVLNALDGVNMPAPLYSDAATTFTILGDTIRLYENQTGTLIRVIRMEEAGEAPVVRRSVSEFTFTIEDAHFALWAKCPDNADCLAGPHLEGDFVGMTLVASDREWPNREFAYIRRHLGG